MSPSLRALATGWLAALLLAAAPVDAARRFAGVDYSDGGDPADPRRLDVNAPGVPGPHPIVVLADVAADEGLVAGLVAREHLVVEVQVREDHAREDLLRAIQFIRRRASSYGGDPLRQVLVAGPMLADAALRVAAEPGRLAADGVPPSALRGVVVDSWTERAPPPLPADGTRHPPVLLVAGAGTAQRLASVTLAERWRAEGAAVEVVQRVPPASLLDLVVGWMPGTAMPRLARYETLRFTADATAPDAAPFAWAGARGALWRVEARDTLRVLRQDVPGGPWTRALDAGGCAPLWFGALRPVAGLWLAADCAGQLRSYALRDDGTFGAPTGFGPAPREVTQAWAVALADGRAVLLALQAAGGSHILRLAGPGPARAEALPQAVRLSGAVVAGGEVYVAGIGPEGGRLLRRIDGPTPVWTTAAAWPAARGSLRAPTALPTEGHAVLGLLDGGEVVRIDPMRGEVHREADLGAAFAGRWGEASSAPRAAGDAFVALRHPQGGDRIHAIGLDLARAQDGARGWYLLRQEPGRFAYGRVGGRDGGATATVGVLLPSPFVADAGAVVYAVASSDPPVLWRGVLPGDAVPQGLWRDVHDPDRGLALFRADPGWMLLHWSTDAGGAPRWASGNGAIDGLRWVPQGPLLRYRRVPGDTRLQAEESGLPDLRFGVAPDDPACAGRAPVDALALAVLALEGDRPRCHVLLAQADEVRPARDGSGIWSSLDGRFGLAVSSAGAGAEGVERALRFDFDEAGAPRWAFGTGTRRDGIAVFALDRPRGDAPHGTLGYRFDGRCARIEGSARIDVGAGEPDGPSAEVVLQRIAGGACY